MIQSFTNRYLKEKQVTIRFMRVPGAVSVPGLIDNIL